MFNNFKYTQRTLENMHFLNLILYLLLTPYPICLPSLQAYLKVIRTQWVAEIRWEAAHN